ncbi:urease accessory protein UreD [Sulfitobacter albidus]|uniref:Urease accessory protein UreD n=1 Tax=Sulfitobacter albidus TaxID=2829501 RepID=A0A975JFC6_9RHOB|nr:urease accessory protein UreD [Sulfitobacter albidus]QUJ77230.1 urease accessory protein UreD [Sulfitobacter albidus]
MVGCLSKGFDIKQLRPSDLTPVAAPRAIGAVALALAPRGGATRVANLRQSGCLKCILPRVFGPQAEAVVVNTAGGVTGGDDLDLRITLAGGSDVRVTTQAAERIYRSADGTPGRIATRVEVGAGARLHWLPQETILFDRAALDRRLHISLAPDARLLAVETHVMGRAAMGEVVHDLALHDRIAVDRVGVPLVRDGVRLHGDADAVLAAAATGGGAGAIATLIYVAPDAAAQLPAIRAMLPETAGVSLRGEDTLLLRALAPDSLSLRRGMIPVLERLATHSLPSVWRL